MNKKLNMCVIEFLDHSGKRGWYDLDNINEIEPETCPAVGFLAGQTEKCYLLAGLNSESGSYGNIIAIVKGAVKKIRKFRIKP